MSTAKEYSVRGAAPFASVAAFVLLWAQWAAGGEALRVAPPPKDDGPGLLFHASFDKDRRAEVAVGSDIPCIARYARQNRTATGGQHVPGVFGKALTGPGGPRGSGDFDALGNFLAERGTVAFHVRQTGMHYGFEPLRVKTVDPYYWFMYLRLTNKSNNLGAWFPDEVYRPIIIGPGARAKLDEGRWHHVAVAWDQAYGMRYYFDGREAASNWGKASWTSRGVDPDALAMEHTDGVAYDELYVFDRPLTAAQIARLASRNVAPKRGELAAVRFDDARRRNRLRELSWQRPDPGMPQIRLGADGLGANAVKQVIPAAARAVKKDCGDAFDGKLGSAWPPLYNYQYAGGNGLHVRVDQPYDLVAIEGYYKGTVYGERRLLPEGGQPIQRIRSRTFLHRWALDAPRDKGWLSFFKQEMEDKGELPDKELVTASRVCEVGFFQRGAHDLEGARARRWYLGPASIRIGDKALGPEFTGRFGPGDRAALALSTIEPRTPGGQAVPGLRYHHILVPASPRIVPLRGLRLVWWVRGRLAENALRVEVRDPMLPGRRLFGLDFALAGTGGSGPQRLDLTLDLADRLLPAGKPLWITFCFKDRVDVLWSGEGRSSFIELLTGTRKQVLPEYLRTELAFTKSRFRWLSEARPWGAHVAPEKDMIEFSRYARELFVPLTQLWELKRDDPKVRALWLWTHKHYQDTSPVKALPVAGCADAPRWALLQRELLARCRDVMYWWIENRQTPNGELGDAWGDDTDLIQNMAKLVLIGDPGGRLARATRLVADGVYKAGRIKRGINARLTDTLHAYEEGVNAQPVMALIDYGNPLYLERMMEAALTADEFLTARDQKGRRRFRSGYFGADAVRDKGKYGFDHPGNALFCHPGLFLAYYGRQPRAVRFLREWIDGWLDYYARVADPKKLRYPKKTLMDGSVIAWDTKVRGYGYLHCYVALHAITGDPRYASVARYCTGAGGPGGGFMRGSDYLPAFEFIDRAKFREHIIKWAEEADLSHPSNDGMGRAARERYMKWEVTGDERAAYQALEACVRKLRLTFEAHTWGEPINDRIWLPDHPLIMMTQGEISDERGQLWPRHYVSYKGFSDFAAWVRKRSDTRLNVWMYSFADKAEDGFVRVWRTPLGEYRVRFGQDRNGDAVPDHGAPQTLALHRSAMIPVRLPARTLCALEIRLTRKSDEDFWKRPDLGISADDVRWMAPNALSVLVHNLGNSPATSVAVRLADASGKTLAERAIPRIDPPLDLKPRTRKVLFTGLRPAKSVVVTIDPENAIGELNEQNNAVRVVRE